MNPFYLVNSEQYARMAARAYEDYSDIICLEQQEKLSPNPNVECHFVRLISLSQRKDDAVVSAIVFQAMAIESYINLMGAYLTNEDDYYKGSKKQSTDWKLRYISKQIGNDFPKELRKRINHLFTRRNKLVHQKPQLFSFDLDNDDIESLRKQKEKLWKQLADVGDGLTESEMSLYDELKEAVKLMRNTETELLAEIGIDCNFQHNSG